MEIIFFRGREKRMRGREKSKKGEGKGGKVIERFGGRVGKL
jgi:hypothetical protein